MKNLLRIFSGDAYKGTKNYLNSQRLYEILRTVLFFSLSGAIFLLGYLTTGTKTNLLTIVAVLGMLPASKSLVSVIMFCRYKSLSEENAKRIEEHAEGLSCLYDRVFTSDKKNFSVGHVTVKGTTICGFTEDAAFDEQAFQKHVDEIMKAEKRGSVVFKVFTDLGKYVDRLDQMGKLSCDESSTEAIMETLKSVSL